jgi:hypothetical protein
MFGRWIEKLPAWVKWAALPFVILACISMIAKQGIWLFLLKFFFSP